MNLKFPLESRTYPFGEPNLPDPNPLYAELHRECHLTGLQIANRLTGAPLNDTYLYHSRYTDPAEF